MNCQEHIFEILLAILILFLFPCIYFSQKHEILAQSIVKSESVQFVDKIRSFGYVTKEEYQEFRDKLLRIDQDYEIQLEHHQKEFEPEYRFRTLEEVKEAQDASYEGSNQYIFRPIHTDIPIVNDPNTYEGNLNTETNETVLQGAENTPADPRHMHSPNCYLGHRHTDGEGVLESSYEHGCYVNPYNTNGHCPGYMVYDGYFLEDHGAKSCTVCGKAVLVYSHGYSCNTCGFGGIYEYEYECIAGHDQGGSGYSPTNCTNVTNITRYLCNIEEDLSVDCSHIISNIAPTHPMQTIYTGEALITTVIATYLDGSQKVVVASPDKTTEQVASNLSVTLTYQYHLMGIDYSKTCNILVNIIPRTKTCSKEHNYHLAIDGSDPGCPYCDAWLLSLVVHDPQTNQLTISKGSTLKENGVTLLATYLNGRNEYLTSEYLDNLDTEYVGTQTVTLSYKGKNTYLTVITKRRQKQCTLCYQYYELYPDNSDPGCPSCAALLPIFTGNVLEYVEKHYQKSIEKEIYDKEGIYYFNNGDYIQISVKEKGSSWYRSLLKVFHINLEPKLTRVIYNGYIREDGGEI